MKKQYFIEYKKGQKITKEQVEQLKKIKLCDWDLKKVNESIYINYGFFKNKQEWENYKSDGELDNYLILERRKFFNYYEYSFKLGKYKKFAY